MSNQLEKVKELIALREKRITAQEGQIYST